MIASRGKFPEEIAIKILRHIVVGFMYLNKENLMHRDLKPSNILLQGGIPKICDFGFCCI